MDHFHPGLFSNLTFRAVISTDPIGTPTWMSGSATADFNTHVTVKSCHWYQFPKSEWRDHTPKALLLSPDSATPNSTKQNQFRFCQASTAHHNTPKLEPAGKSPSRIRQGLGHWSQVTNPGVETGKLWCFEGHRSQKGFVSRDTI